MTKVGIKREWEMSDDFILDAIIDTAGYGINYWANWADIDSEARTYTVEDMFGDFGPKVLTFDALGEALVRVAYDPEVRVRDDIRDWAREALDELEAGDEFPGGSIDAWVADVIVQVAAFNEIVYG